MPTLVTLTHEERKERRRKMARAVKRGKPIIEVADEFGVGLYTVREACREFGVSGFVKDLNPSTYQIIAALLRGESRVLIATSLGITEQRVGQIVAHCRAAGIALPKPRR